MTETNPMGARYVLGVDPGTTTGLSVVRFPEPGEDPFEIWGEQLPWSDACRKVAEKVRWLDKMKDLRTTTKNVAVACEKFTLNAQTAQRGQEPADDAMGMIGVVRMFCEAYSVWRPPLEQASAAKTLASDAVLKSLGLHRPGLKHVNDAVRQTVLFAVKQRWMEPRLLARSL